MIYIKFYECPTSRTIKWSKTGHVWSRHNFGGHHRIQLINLPLGANFQLDMHARIDFGIYARAKGFKSAAGVKLCMILT